MNQPADERVASIVADFVRAWDTGAAPDIGKFLAATPAEARRQALIGLASFDMERRWTLAVADTRVSGETATLPGVEFGPPTRLLWEDYVSRFADFVSLDEVPLKAVGHEYQVRRRCGDQPTHDQYVRRFPERADQLRRLLTELDALDNATMASGPSPATPRPFEDGNREFGEYELLEEIARGGMGVVYKARQVNANRIVALKMILSGQLAGEQEVKRFYAEAEAAANLDHPHIVPVFDVGRVQQQHYFSMGFVDGSSLKELLQQGPLAPRDAARLLNDIAEAVAYAHGKGVIHRDLKPANVLLDSRGHARVSDFGLAKQLSGESDLTMTGQIMGTPSYMPPEQARGEAVGTTADIYSLGAMLYETMTGRKPFVGDNSLEILRQVLDSEPPSPRSLIATIPRDLETICLKCLHKDADKRYRTVAELIDDLGNYLSGRPVAARPVTNSERLWRWCQRNPTAALLSTGLLTLICATAVVASVAYLHQARLANDLSQALVARTAALGEAESARKTAEELRVVAVNESAEAERARQQEQLLRTEGQLLLASTYFERGSDACEQGEIDRGLHWMALALATLPAGANPELERTIRLNIDSWRPWLHRLRAWRPIPAAYLETTRDGRQFIAFLRARSENLIFSASDALPARTQPAVPVAELDEVLLSRQDVLAMRRGARVMFWDVVKQSHFAEAAVPEKPIGMAFTGDGEFLAVSSPQAVFLYRVRNGELAQKRGHEQGITAVIPSNSDAAVAAVTSDRHVLLWERGAEEPHRFDETAYTAAFSPDGLRIALAAASYGSVNVYDVATKNLLHELRHPIWSNAADEVSYDAAGTRILTTRNGLADIWDTESHQHLGSSMRHDNQLASAKFSRRGDLILSWGRRETRIWDAATADQVGQTLRRQSLAGAALRLGDSMVTADGDSLAVWQTQVDQDHWLPTRPLIRSSYWMIANPHDTPTAITFGNSFGLIDLEKRRPLPDLEPGLEAHHCTLSSDETHVALVKYPVVGDDNPGGAQVVEVATGKPIGQFLPDVNYVEAVHPRGSHLLGKHNGNVVLWNTATAEAEVIDWGDSPLAIGGDIGFCGIPDNPDVQGRVFELKSKQVRAELCYDGAAFERAALSTDEQLLALADTDSVVTVWETTTGRRVGKSFLTTGCHKLDVCPSRRLVAVGNSQGVVQVWDFTTGRKIGPPLLNRGAVRGLSFSRKGEFLLTGGVSYISRRAIPADSRDSPDAVALQIQVDTGAELDELGAIRPLKMKDWQRQRRRAGVRAAD